MTDIPPEARRKFWEMLHRIVVLFDDWLCDTFGFSRQARGKYARGRER